MGGKSVKTVLPTKLIIQRNEGEPGWSCYHEIRNKIKSSSNTWSLVQ